MFFLHWKIHNYISLVGTTHKKSTPWKHEDSIKYLSWERRSLSEQRRYLLTFSCSIPGFWKFSPSFWLAASSLPGPCPPITRWEALFSQQNLWQGTVPIVQNPRVGNLFWSGPARVSDPDPHGSFGICFDDYGSSAINGRYLIHSFWVGV